MTKARARKEMRTAHLLLRKARAYLADRLVVLCLLIVARQQIRAVHTRPLALCDNRRHDEHGIIRRDGRQDIFYWQAQIKLLQRTTCMIKIKESHSKCHQKRGSMSVQ
jgi:hypothetical protein